MGGVDVKHIKRIPAVAWSAFLVLAGAGSALAGVYLLTGLAVTLIVGGVAATALGLLVDV